MGVAFPLSPVPSYYTQITPSNPHSIWYVGDAPSFTLSKSGATTYSVRDYFGNIVSTGMVSGTSLSPATPSRGWKPGWYRLYLTGGSTDTLFGSAYGSINFVIFRNDPRFPTAVAGGSSGGESRDIRTKAVVGMGTSRLSVESIASPNLTSTGVMSDVTTSNNYWSVSSGAYFDSARPRFMWTNFPDDTSSNLSNVTSVVSTLYPLGVTRFEGPYNEPVLNAALVTKMQQFHDAVKAGNANAVVLGPTPVRIDATDGGGLEQFLAAGGGNYIDEWSVHAYNSQTNGDLSVARSQWGAFKAMLAKYGQGSKPIWQTESTHVFHSIYGVYHPRRARVPLLQTLYCEQIGIPRERNNYWYDNSHGFWSYPSWWQNGDSSPNPVAALYRVLAEETFGMAHSSALSFGAIGDRIFIGSLYVGSAGSVVVVQAQSSLSNASITFSITGASTLTAVDGQGNASTLTVTNGQVVLPVGEIPAYLRLPIGASAIFHHCNDWPANTLSWTDSATSGQATASGALQPLTNNGQWMTSYTGNAVNDGIYLGGSLPDALTVTWPTAARFDRVIAWGGSWQFMSTLVDFDVQTSIDGVTWITQATVTKSTPASFQFGSSSTGVGCQYETYWDEQWIFDVKLPAPVVAKAVRLYVRATSYGGEPDLLAMSAGGQGSGAQAITLQEIVTVCDDNVIIPRWVHI